MYLNLTVHKDRIIIVLAMLIQSICCVFLFEAFGYIKHMWLHAKTQSDIEYLELHTASESLINNILV